MINLLHLFPIFSSVCSSAFSAPSIPLIGSPYPRIGLRKFMTFRTVGMQFRSTISQESPNQVFSMRNRFEVARSYASTISTKMVEVESALWNSINHFICECMGSIKLPIYIELSIPFSIKGSDPVPASAKDGHVLTDRSLSIDFLKEFLPRRINNSPFTTQILSGQRYMRCVA